MSLPYPAYDACFCRACVPTSAPTVCSRCGEEIRIGWRDGQRGWWHREPVDHFAALGHIITREEKAEAERQMDLVRERVSEKTGQVQTYTARRP